MKWTMLTHVAAYNVGISLRDTKVAGITQVDV